MSAHGGNLSHHDISLITLREPENASGGVLAFSTPAWNALLRSLDSR